VGAHGLPVIASTNAAAPSTLRQQSEPEHDGLRERPRRRRPRRHKVSLTLKDGEAMKAALLEAIEQSNVEHKAELLQGTEPVPVSIDSGYLRIGVWILQAKGNDLVWRYRMLSGEQMRLSYLATAVKQGDEWLVRDVGPELAHRR
jgi:hypothetical protein